MKLGMICRMDNSGLGTLSWEFARHLKPHKVLLVSNGAFKTFPERYSEFNSKEYKNDNDWGWLLEDIDVLLSIETFYNWGIIKDCRKKGIKTALYTMYEMMMDPIPLIPDLFICPSKLDVQYFKEYPHVYLPPPIAEDRIFWKKRTKAKVFIHTASHGGMSGRKGTQLFIEAISKVEAKVQFKIYSWRSFPIPNDSRIELNVVNFKNYWQIWREGDVLVYPQDYNGICLPVIEALASGLGVISTDIFPFNEYLPKELLFKPESMYRTRAAPRLMETDAAKINPATIAQKIDQWANRDISKFSEYGRKWGQENSWKKLLSAYLNVFEDML